MPDLYSILSTIIISVIVIYSTSIFCLKSVRFLLLVITSANRSMPRESSIAILAKLIDIWIRTGTIILQHLLIDYCSFH